MTKQEISDKMITYLQQEGQLLRAMVEPARAAANQMKDAGMHMGSQALLQALFEYDAWKSAFDDFTKENLQDLVTIMVGRIKGGGA